MRIPVKDYGISKIGGIAEGGLRAGNPCITAYAR